LGEKEKTNKLKDTCELIPVECGYYDKKLCSHPEIYRSYNGYCLNEMKGKRKNERSKSNQLGEPIHRINGSYFFPKAWNWHNRVQFIAKKLKDNLEYLLKSIMYDIDD
jgi:hypothetical protein